MPAPAIGMVNEWASRIDLYCSCEVSLSAINRVCVACMLQSKHSGRETSLFVESCDCSHYQPSIVPYRKGTVMF